MRCTGISEYIFFLLAVLGLFRLRQSRPYSDSAYKTRTANLVVFCIFSGLLVIRGVITDPLQGVVIVVLALIGLALFRQKNTGL